MGGLPRGEEYIRPDVFLVIVAVVVVVFVVVVEWISISRRGKGGGYESTTTRANTLSETRRDREG